MARGRPKRKFKKSSSIEISPKLGKTDRRRALDKVRRGGSDKQEASVLRPDEQELGCVEMESG